MKKFILSITLGLFISYFAIGLFNNPTKVSIINFNFSPSNPVLNNKHIDVNAVYLGLTDLTGIYLKTSSLYLKYLSKDNKEAYNKELLTVSGTAVLLNNQIFGSINFKDSNLKKKYLQDLKGLTQTYPILLKTTNKINSKLLSENRESFWSNDIEKALYLGFSPKYSNFLYLCVRDQLIEKLKTSSGQYKISIAYILYTISSAYEENGDNEKLLKKARNDSKFTKSILAN